MSDLTVSDDRARKERSPSFPFISLARALDRAKAMAEAHKRNPARPAVVGETWGYGPKSSGLLQTVAALKAFGLTDDVGRGDDRRIVLSDLAWRILFDTRGGAREAAIKEAAVRPRLIAEYARQWLPERPSDNHCISELHIDRGFTADAAKAFLRVFDETVAFANLKEGDSLSQSPDPAPMGQDLVAVSTPSLEARMHPIDRKLMGLIYPPARTAPQVITTTITPRATLPLPEGTVALEIPLGLSRKSYEAFKAWATMMVSLTEKDIVERWYVETYLPTSTQAETAQVIHSWSIVKGFMEAKKQSAPETIFRVIAPDTATEADLAELRSMGVRTF